MVNLFDYVYYRVYRYFLDKGDNIPETKGALVLSLLQFFTLLDIFVLIREFHPFILPPDYSVLLIAIVLVAVNLYRYERHQMDILNNKWQNEDNLRRKRNGYLIGLYLIVSIVIPIVYRSR
jgi:hypothetical protein